MLGICLVTVSAMLLCRASGLYYEEKIRQYNDILSFLVLIRYRIDSSASKISSILNDVPENSYLCICGFIELARSEGLYAAFLKHEKNMFLENDDKKLISEYFLNFGKNFLLHEIEKTNRCIIGFEASLGQLKDKLPQKKKINMTVIVSGAALFIIIFI